MILTHQTLSLGLVKLLASAAILLLKANSAQPCHQGKKRVRNMVRKGGDEECEALYESYEYTNNYFQTDTRHFGSSYQEQ